jgi:hypothetical protein
MRNDRKKGKRAGLGTFRASGKNNRLLGVPAAANADDQGPSANAATTVPGPFGGCLALIEGADPDGTSTIARLFSKRDKTAILWRVSAIHVTAIKGQPLSVAGLCRPIAKRGKRMLPFRTNSNATATIGREALIPGVVAATAHVTPDIVKGRMPSSMRNASASQRLHLQAPTRGSASLLHVPFDDEQICSAVTSNPTVNDRSPLTIADTDSCFDNSQSVVALSYRHRFLFGHACFSLPNSSAFSKQFPAADGQVSPKNPNLGLAA